MKIPVIVHTNSKQPRTTLYERGCLHVYVKEPPLQGRANKAVIDVLSEYFKVKKYQITLLRGQKSKQKVFRVNV